MKKQFTILCLLFSLISYSQIKEFTANDVLKVSELIGFSGIKTFKGLNYQDQRQVLREVLADSDNLKQLNIDIWYICDNKKINNLETYNYYYKKKISITTYNQYYKEISALMFLDGIIK